MAKKLSRPIKNNLKLELKTSLVAERFLVEGPKLNMLSYLKDTEKMKCLKTLL